MDEELKHAASLLPPDYYKAVMDMRAPVEDIRLRLGRPAAVTVLGREIQLASLAPLDERGLLWTLEKASCSSIYSVQDTLCRGYINASFGVRIGVCGTGVNKEGKLAALKDISSLSIRVSRQCRGAADGLLPPAGSELKESVLIISPPGWGKTSLLRDMVRQLSYRGLRIAVADERGEIAAMSGGVPGFDVGPCTDVLENVEKEEAALMLIKTMSPQLIAMDEISAPGDARAVESARGNGVRMIATVHGRDEREVLSRPVLRQLVNDGAFTRAVIIELSAEGRRYRQTSLAREGQPCL